eukprot:jgi/Psemu1/192896/e_gw1.134.5.1
MRSSSPPPSSSSSLSIPKEGGGAAATATAEYATTDQLERCGKWLASIPRDDITVLRHTVEFQEFLKAFERLGQAHIRVVVNNNNNNNNNNHGRNHHKTTADSGKPNSSHAMLIDTGYDNVYRYRDDTWEDSHQPTHNHFLRFTDDVLLRIFEFLRCRCLIQTSITCSRFYQLARRSATQRTCDIVHTRQLGNVMQLLRAREQIYYIDDNNIHSNHNSARGTNNNTATATATATTIRVPVPTLLPGRRVLVENSGDPEYNGVYYCTEYNSNGFVFTKPRRSPQHPSAQHEREHNHERNHEHEHAADGMVLDHADGFGIDDANANANMLPRHNGDAGPLRMPDHHNIHDRFDQFDPRSEHDRTHQRAIASGHYNNRGGLSGHFEKEPLRCFIAKSYSASHLLWYMGKEVETGGNSVTSRKRKKAYDFYAPLLLSASAVTELHYYPSQSGALLHQNDRWRPLRGSVLQPPTVEVVDTNDSNF